MSPVFSVRGQIDELQDARIPGSEKRCIRLPPLPSEPLLVLHYRLGPNLPTPDVDAGKATHDTYEGGDHSRLLGSHA